MTIKEILANIGVDAHNTGHAEKVISATGGFIGILLTIWIGLHYVGAHGAALLAASMGASAVLLFAAPHSPLTQPWQLIGGNTISAVIGVFCAQMIPDPLVAAPLAVGLAIAAMHYLRCLHPPGGGTVLVAVIGGPEVHALGYWFVLTPVLLNVAVMLLTAILVNYAFPWRRYPASLGRKPVKDPLPGTAASDSLGHADFEYALNEIGSFVDITEDDLSRIYKLALKHSRQQSDQTGTIEAGNYYSNGATDELRSVRKVIELAGEGNDALVTYTIVEGKGQGSLQSTTLADFKDWQKHEVILKHGTWQKIL